MKIKENGHRFSDYYLWEDLKNQPYNYEKQGLIRHLLSHKIVESKNKLLQYVLRYYEYSIVYYFKAADILKNFKNFNWKNR